MIDPPALDAQALRTTLARTQEELLAASQRAGMAEVATGALHNVGNVLNSVNVSTAMLLETLATSRVDILARAVAMMQAHEDDLGAFLADDPKGRKLPTLLQMVSAQLTEERERMKAELMRLTQHIELMRSTIEAQQALAKRGQVREEISPQALLDRTLSMFRIELSHREVRHTMTSQVDTPVLVDTQAVLQILANLVRNAITAVEDRDERQIEIRVHADDDQLSFEVQDNGCGIPPENLPRLFDHGFTTRANGHGFGLHASALAAQAMHGTLVATSDGPGHGARFTLSIPRVTS